MFTKLRIKLTLINASIILALFLVLAIGTYCFFKADMARKSSFFSQRLAADIQAGLIVDLPGPKAGLPGLKPPLQGPKPPDHGAPPPFPEPPRPIIMDTFFVKTAPSGTITFASSSQPLASDQLAKLTDAALKAADSQGALPLGEDNYTYLKTPLANEAGTLIVFHDTAQEVSLLRGLLTALSAVAIICVLLSLGASHFLAKRALIPIQAAWQQQKDFLSDASHELRTPLAVTQANLDIVLTSPEETVASQHPWLMNIREELDQMGHLVDSLLFLARADSGRQPSARQPFSPAVVLARAAAPFRPVAAASGVTLSVACDSGFTAEGNERQFVQLIGILLDNALRHTPRGGEVSISLLAAGKDTVLEVADTGEGIAPEHLDKIFDRFYQVDKARSSGGAGLGLAIAKWIVESHGGQISVKSQVGRGATFSLRFPWRPPAASPAQPIDN